MKFIVHIYIAIFLLTAATSESSSAAEKNAVGPDQGGHLFQENCAHCHNGSVPKAPSETVFRKMAPSVIYNTLTRGVMAPMAKHLSEEERRQIAEYLTMGSLSKFLPPLQCKNDSHWFDYSQHPLISGGGMANHYNTRLIPGKIAGLSVSDIQKLKLKWSFAFPNTIRTRSQPAIAGGGLFIGGGDGTIYALDPESGCVHWTFKASSEVRTAITIDNWSEDNEKGVDYIPSIYFGDITANAYAVNAVTGELRWKIKLDDHPGARISGSVVKHNNRLYIPISAGQDPTLSCCTFRGSVSSLIADTGRVVWKSYVIPEEPVEQYKNAAGVPQYGPSGAGVWNTPTLDIKRRRLYVGTGENSSSPAVNGGAIVAMDLNDGRIAWVMQASPGEAYNATCSKLYFDDDMNCPKEYKGRIGLDFAGGSPILLKGKNGSDVLIAGQKTGWVFGMDPDHNGKVLWRRSISRGDYNKGNWFGMAVDDSTVFVTVNDLYADPLKGQYLGVEELGVHALNGFTGEWLWSAPVSRDCRKERCRGYGSALTSIPGVVFAGSQDGYFRAFETTTGKLLWDFNTSRKFTTVNGNTGSGGTIGGSGPVIANGHVYLNSGYSYTDRDKTGNVLLVFAIEGK